MVNYIFRRAHEPMRSACEVCDTMLMEPVDWIEVMLGGTLARAFCMNCAEKIAGLVIKEVAPSLAAEPRTVDLDAARERMAHAREVKAAKRAANGGVTVEAS
jgi:hypothetical protein